MKEIFRGWRRNEDGDRPKLRLTPFTDGTTPIIPQQVGFVDENGTLIEISVERALELGLIAIGEVEISSMNIEEYLKQRK